MPKKKKKPQNGRGQTRHEEQSDALRELFFVTANRRLAIKLFAHQCPDLWVLDSEFRERCPSCVYVVRSRTQKLRWCVFLHSCV